jgi:hypothetical protein
LQESRGDVLQGELDRLLIERGRLTAILTAKEKAEASSEAQVDQIRCQINAAFPLETAEALNNFGTYCLLDFRFQRALIYNQQVNLYPRFTSK